MCGLWDQFTVERERKGSDHHESDPTAPSAVIGAYLGHTVSPDSEIAHSQRRLGEWGEYHGGREGQGRARCRNYDRLAQRPTDQKRLRAH